MRKLVVFTVLAMFVFVAAANQISAQSNDNLNAALNVQMKGIAKRYADSVVLRWAPGNAFLWRLSRTQGYNIERAEVINGNVGPYVALTVAPVTQWTTQQWTTFLQTYQYADSTDEQLIAVASILSEQADSPTDTPVKDLGDLQALREKKSQSEMTFAYALIIAERNRIAANSLAMRFVDKSATLGKEYRYRISMLGSTTPYNVTAALVDVSPRANTAEQNDAGLSALALDTKVVLTWANTTGHSTFDVYRSNNGSQFTKLNITPLLTIRHGTADAESNGYIDSNLVNYTTYTYRVTGNNSFAEVEEIGTINAMPHDVTPPPTPSGVRTEHVGVKSVAITWHMPDAPMPDLLGFYIQRGRSEDGTFQLVTTTPLAKNIRSYLDTTAALGDTLYYQVVAVDTAKNGSLSFAVYVAFADSIAPSPAVLIRGVMDTAGVVRITVQHPTDADVMGYRLLIANDSTHEFTVKRELFDEETQFNREDTILLDTAELRTLTKFVYYQVIALDYHFNESVVSNMIAVPRPDIIPPVSPVVTDYVVTDSSIVLFYNPSTSRDVSHHVIQRRPFNATSVPPTTWDSLARGGITDSIIVDQTGTLSATYQYAVIAFDSAGNVSPLSNIVTLVRYDNGIRPPVTTVRAAYDSTTKSVRLQWEYIDLGEEHSFMIYKRNGAALESYALVKDQLAREYIDLKGAKRNATFAIKVICSRGAESKMSESATAR
ncbi:MAG: hypothetical protein HQ472_02140 [Ignavibacteria bacterium]|nr:hypothetical protein [Ignavibacteria bacterium]